MKLGSVMFVLSLGAFTTAADAAESKLGRDTDVSALADVGEPLVQRHATMDGPAYFARRSSDQGIGPIAGVAGQKLGRHCLL